MKKLLIFIYLLTFFPGVAAAEQLKQIMDLRAEFSRIEKSGIPLLLLFSSEECEYCEFVKENYLLPMQNDAAYRNKITIRELIVDSYIDLIDHDGNKTTADQLALRYSADLSPTIVFLNAQGRELSEKIVGIGARDYFDLRLDNAINESLASLRQNDAE